MVQGEAKQPWAKSLRALGFPGQSVLPEATAGVLPLCGEAQKRGESE